ncbi:F-BAR domain only protein 2 isoform X4 [Chironomus tepperi]|uniref:F-BAR domain only protein 2 isoform X4 n=1 Tax=Chironomus tepperi TaxID=113505 RepID=UPI00391F9DD4
MEEFQPVERSQCSPTNSMYEQYVEKNFDEYVQSPKKGDKNNGYEVLYQNMKHGVTASKELMEYFKERSNLDEHNSKVLLKLAHKVGSSGASGTFSPLLIILKTSAERLSELHTQMMQKTTELVKNILKYADELHKKHKTVKEEESSTQDAVHQMKESTTAVQKAKDLYQSRLQELEKLRRDNGSAKDIEKAETKLKKHQEEYKNLAEKHNPIKQEFEQRMAATCKRFQDIEEAHLKQMKEFIMMYIEIVQNNHDLVGQVQSDFKRQFLDLTVDKLLEQFVLNKYTGLEKPANIDVELSPQQTSQNLIDTSVSSPANDSHGMTINTMMNLTFETQQVQQQQQQQITSGKKETYLLSWFTSSTSTTSASMNNTSVVSATSSSSAITASPPTIVPRYNANEFESSQHDDSSSPSMKINNKLSYGEKFISKFNKNGNKATTSSEHQNSDQMTSTAGVSKHEQQQKSSRRTTSLLNLFMSNPQGSRESRDNISSSVISAPTSPVEQTPLKLSANIGRNPLRGSKFSGFLRSRRDKKPSKKKDKKKKDGETNSTKEEAKSDGEEKDDTLSAISGGSLKPEISGHPTTTSNVTVTTPTLTTSSITGNTVPTATPEVDEDEYSVKPQDNSWNKNTSPQKNKFYSSSDSDSDDEIERKIHVEIKPLNNGTAPISASVDELRATVENLSLSPIGALSQHHQSPIASNASTPTTAHPYAPLQSPTLSMTNNSTSNRYADLDIFSEVGDISSAPASANLSKLNRQIPTPNSSIAIPRPPSRRSEQIRAGRVSPAMARADSVGSLEFRTVSANLGSRGPSPLTIGMSDTIPLAIAFHEIIHAYFKGSDESRCQVKMSGDMMLSFPAGIVNVLANNPNPAKLCFRIKNVQNLENILPNKQLINVEKSTSNTILEFNMPALTLLLRRQSEQNPTASYFNVDILKYTIKSKTGAQSCPFQLVSYWKCEPSHTDIKIDYKYNNHAMASASPLLNVSISVPVDGGVRNVQSKPHSAWLGESNKLVWNFTDISQHSDNGGIDTLRARLEVSNGPSTPSILTTQFNCEGTTLSGIDFELTGTGYRISLVKRRFVAGKYICEGDGIRNIKTPTPPSVTSPSLRTG